MHNRAEVENEIIKAYIGLGSNLGDRAGNLLLAARGLMEAGLHVSRLSGIYQTEPVEVSEHAAYLNMVAEVDIANTTPSQLLARLLRIEYLLGRRHKFLRAPRTADLDLLFYGDTHIDTEHLKVPHRRLHQRRFVLTPLCELAPHLVHPVEKKTVRELFDALEDNSKVVRWNPNAGLKLGKISDPSIDISMSKTSSS